MDLEHIKQYAEKMSMKEHIEILKILKKNPAVKLNENKNGVFINLSFLPESTLGEIVEYINYIKDQENTLKFVEIQKEEFKSTFFHEKEDKDIPAIYCSNG
jgi:hypothetical protein